MAQKTLFVVAPLLLASCFGDVWADGANLFPEPDVDTTTGGPGTGVPTTSGSDGVQTVTSLDPATGEPTSTSEPSAPETTTGSTGEANQPVIVSFSIEPPTLEEAGVASVNAVVSEDVVELRLAVDGVEVWAGPPGALAWQFEATSAEKSAGVHTFLLTARNDEDLEVTAPAELAVTMPASGTVRCEFLEDAGASWLAATVFTADAIVLAGTLADPGSQAALWRLDPDLCQPQAGYPWSISQWTSEPLALEQPSQAVALAVDEEGRVAIAANLGTGLMRRPYVALLTDKGALVWERIGAPGRTYSGITFAPGRVVVVGEELVNEVPKQYDGLVEGYVTEDGQKAWSRVIAAPLAGDNFVDLDNELSEHPRAIVWRDGVVLIVGERDVKGKDDENLRRGFTASFGLHGSEGSTWTSSGAEGSQDALLSVARCGEDFIAGGWVQDAQARLPVTRWLDLQHHGDVRRIDALADASIAAVACDREQKVTAAAIQGVSALTLGFRTTSDPFVYKIAAQNSLAFGADCDDRGFCVVAGLKGQQAWARVHHP